MHLSLTKTTAKAPKLVGLARTSLHTVCAQRTCKQTSLWDGPWALGATAKLIILSYAFVHPGCLTSPSECIRLAKRRNACITVMCTTLKGTLALHYLNARARQQCSTWQDGMRW